MFQRQIIQVCDGQGAALINMLDPEIFPYTQVNGSTFPAPDATLKNSTPQVGSPTYADDINAFIQANVPDSALGQPVNFNLTFNTLGGLTIWGAPPQRPTRDRPHVRLPERLTVSLIHSGPVSFFAAQAQIV